jgi:hypothetical protein
MMQQVYDVLGDIVSIAGSTPSSVGESEVWKAIVDHTEQDKQNLCKVLKAKQLIVWYLVVHLLCMWSSAAETNYHRGLPLAQSWPSLPITVLALGCHHSPALGIELL